MAGWNGNEYGRNFPNTDRDGAASGGRWPPNYGQRPPAEPSSTNPYEMCQYVGFNDFLDQFQRNKNYQNYGTYPIEQQQQRPLLNQSQFMSYRGGDLTQYEQQDSSLPRYPYNPYTTEPRVPYSAKPNYTTLSGGSTVTDVDPNIEFGSRNDSVALQPVTFVSNLTPTAEEFVPQSARNYNTEVEGIKENVDPRNVTEPVDASQAVEKNTPLTREKDKADSPRRYDRWNSQDRYNNTNWRSRDEDTEPLQDSFTVYNTNRHGHDDKTNVRENYYSGKWNNSRNKSKHSTGESTSRDDNLRNGNGKYNRNETHSVYNERNYSNDKKWESNRNYNNKSKVSNDRQQHSTYNESQGDRREIQNEHKYTNRNNSINTYRNGSESDRSKNRSKGSYNVNETFRQRNFPPKHENDVESDRDVNNKYKRTGSDEKPTSKEPEDVGQRERLTDQVNRGTLECLVCCERVRPAESVWSCSNCYHILHLQCVRKWASSSIIDGEWRCPACQHKVGEVPKEYWCFCGSRRSPEWRRGDTAHSCGDPCQRHTSCAIHPCTLPCHPGPCPICNATIQRKCECGATSQRLKCSLKTALVCGGVCGKTLNCGVHTCTAVCHAGPCQPCQQKVQQKCYCLKEEKREVPCSESSVGVEGFSCEQPCGKQRSCTNHTCSEPCHPGPCPMCPLDILIITHCPCQRTKLKVARKSCLDPVETCSRECSRLLSCGPADTRHTCKAKCHHGECPPCPDKTEVNCRCGHVTRWLPCTDLATQRDTVQCGRKCTKKMSCGRHRCKETCCVETEHICLLPCTRTLSCGLHRCPDTCHRAHCQPCSRISFEELRCRCGVSVRYPPVECGARPPACTQPCPEVRPCSHPPLHSCHPHPSPCPPCTVLTTKYCYGRHKMRKTIPCHQEEFSCGLACGKELSCGRHKCQEQCHKGDCPTVCKQTCETERPGCGHPCGSGCGHPQPCPSVSACRAAVTAVCPCGRRSERRQCHEQRAALHRLTALPGPLGEPVDIAQLIKQGNNNVTLECDMDCQLEDRNRRLAIGLQIRNPDLSSKLAPKFSDFLKQMASREENFAVRVHEQLSQLVLLAKESKQRTRSHSFQPMSRQKRQFVHEMCQHFGCDSAAYDAEPYRNVVATAFKEKSWLPSLSLLEVMRREKGQRRVPGPVLPNAPSTQSAWSGQSSAWATLGPAATPTTTAPPDPPRKPRIDYFDTPPED